MCRLNLFWIRCVEPLWAFVELFIKRLSDLGIMAVDIHAIWICVENAALVLKHTLRNIENVQSIHIPFEKRDPHVCVCVRQSERECAAKAVLNLIHIFYIFICMPKRFAINCIFYVLRCHSFGTCSALMLSCSAFFPKCRMSLWMPYAHDVYSAIAIRPCICASDSILCVSFFTTSMHVCLCACVYVYVFSSMRCFVICSVVICVVRGATYFLDEKISINFHVNSFSK